MFLLKVVGSSSTLHTAAAMSRFRNEIRLWVVAKVGVRKVGSDVSQTVGLRERFLAETRDKHSFKYLLAAFVLMRKHSKQLHHKQFQWICMIKAR
jgi:hypothetical protein